MDANAGRIKLEGRGPGRMHWYKGVRPDYWEQITSEVKAPASHSARRVWQKKSGVRNEALDCEVYALHAARSLKLHLWSPARWDQEKSTQLQMDLLSTEAPKKPEEKKEAPVARDDFFNAFNGNNSW